MKQMREGEGTGVSIAGLHGSLALMRERELGTRRLASTGERATPRGRRQEGGNGGHGNAVNDHAK
jgi:hypothetical protein